MGVGAQVVHDEPGVDGAAPGRRARRRGCRRARRGGRRPRRGSRGTGGPARGRPAAPRHRCRRRRRAPGAETRLMPAEKSKVAMGSDVGRVEPPSGSTEIAAASAAAASPLSRTWRSPPDPDIRPAGTIGCPGLLQPQLVDLAARRRGHVLGDHGTALPSLTERNTVAVAPSGSRTLTWVASSAVITRSTAAGVARGRRAVPGLCHGGDPEDGERRRPRPPGWPAETAGGAGAPPRPGASGTVLVVEVGTGPGGSGRTVADAGEHACRAGRPEAVGRGVVGQQHRGLAQARPPRPGSRGTRAGAPRSRPVRRRRGRRRRRHRTARGRAALDSVITVPPPSCLGDGSIRLGCVSWPSPPGGRASPRPPCGCSP